MLNILFWVSFLFILFTYIGYPVSLKVLSWCCSKPVKKKEFDCWPRVSVVLAVKNEESNIRRRIENLVEQEYPNSPIEVIVVSDGSQDKTLNILKELQSEYQHSQIDLKILERSESFGKPSVLNLGMETAQGAIIVFADARQQYSQTAIRNLVSNFSDLSVGCVSGELQFVQEDNFGIKLEMGAYWNYEKLIRKMESASGSVMGATGAIYAIRKELYTEISPLTLLDDVLIPLTILCQKYRVVFDQTAIAYDVVSKDVGSEWNRKVRTLAGNWQLALSQGMAQKACVHHFFYRYFWHKLARLLVPYFLVIVFFTSSMLDGIFYDGFVVLQSVFYLFALLAHFFKSCNRIPFVKLCYFFCVLNLAAVAGFWVWIQGQCGQAWKDTASCDEVRK